MPTLKVSPANVPEGGTIRLTVTEVGDLANLGKYTVTIIDDQADPQTAVHSISLGDPNVTVDQANQEVTYDFVTSGLANGSYTVQLGPNDGNDNQPSVRFTVGGPTITTRTFLQRASAIATTDQALWAAIRNRTAAISFPRYNKFINLVFGCAHDSDLDVSKLLEAQKRVRQDHLLNVAEAMEIIGPKSNWELSPPHLTVQGPYAYALLKFATQVFLALESGVIIRDGDANGHRLFNTAEEAYRLNDPTVTIERLTDLLSQYLSHGSYGEVLPYLDRIVGALLAVTPADAQTEVLPYCYGILQYRFTQPSLLELIWSYWHEEGMLAQTMNVLAMRFQNQRYSPHDPLAELELDPLRPLNNIIWGYVQDEHNRLTVRRRAFEYDHHYGLKLLGRAVPELYTADSRSKFLEAFHNLLYRTAVFYREDSDTTVIADTFPLLNALKDVHLLLAEGAHNQYGDLPWTARAEMLIQQWMLARPEMREFLRGRHMVPYQELWMGAVDAMKKLQGWTDTTITHFHELAVDGERLLLSIRFGDWSELDNIEEQARNWARYWKPEVQRYLYGYLAATGVDLMVDITDNREAATRYLQPSQLLQRRLAAQGRQAAIAAKRPSPALASSASSFVRLPRGERVHALKHHKNR
jgi:hypothetical protein